MDSSFLGGLEVSSTSDSEEEVRKPKQEEEKTMGNSSSDVEEISSIRVVKQSTARSFANLRGFEGNSSTNVEAVTIACLPCQKRYYLKTIASS